MVNQRDWQEQQEARLDIYHEIDVERTRQDEKFGWIGSASLLPGDNDWAKYAVLGEEVGEVARALLERSFGNDTTEHLETELIQVAAVAIAWVEAARIKRGRARLCNALATWRHADGSVRVDHMDSRPGDYFG